MLQVWLSSALLCFRVELATSIGKCRSNCVYVTKKCSAMSAIKSNASCTVRSGILAVPPRPYQTSPRRHLKLGPRRRRRPLRFPSIRRLANDLDKHSHSRPLFMQLHVISLRIIAFHWHKLHVNNTKKPHSLVQMHNARQPSELRQFDLCAIEHEVRIL